MGEEQLRVVHLAAYGGAYTGSFIPMMQAARRAVESRGWAFETVFSSGAERYPWHGALRESGFPTRVAPALGRGAAVPWTRELLDERQGPTLLHTHFSQWDVPAVLAGRRHRDTAVVWHLHTRLEDDTAAVLRNAVRFGSFGRLTDRILCVAPQIREKAVRRLAPARRTEVLTNGIDVSRFAPPPAQARLKRRSETRERLGVPQDRTVLLMFAWDWETKGGELLLETVRELRARSRDVHAVIVGSQDTAQSEARVRGVEDLVHPIGPVQDTPALYGAVDLFIAGSVAEGMPFSLLEAVAAGTPVLASDIPGHRFAARSLPACRLAPRLPGAFADAIEAEIAADDNDRERRLAQSRTWIEQELSLSSWSQRLGEVYDSVASRRRWGVR